MIVVEDRSREDAEDTVCFLAGHQWGYQQIIIIIIIIPCPLLCHGVHGITITSCSTSETPVLRASTVLCSTCLENSIDWWWYQYQCYHIQEIISLQVDLRTPRIYYAWLLHIQSCWNIQFKYEHYEEWSQWSIRWTTHDSHWSTCQKGLTLIWLHCVTKITTVAQGGMVMCWTTDLLLKQYVYLLCTPNDISKIIILAPTILHEPTNETFLDTTISFASRMSLQQRGTNMTHFQQEKSGTNYKVNPSSSTPHSDNNYTQSIASPQSLNHSLTSNIHCRWCW